MLSSMNKVGPGHPNPKHRKGSRRIWRSGFATPSKPEITIPVELIEEREALDAQREGLRFHVAERIASDPARVRSVRSRQSSSNSPANHLLAARHPCPYLVAQVPDESLGQSEHESAVLVTSVVGFVHFGSTDASEGTRLHGGGRRCEHLADRDAGSQFEQNNRRYQRDDGASIYRPSWRTHRSAHRVDVRRQTRAPFQSARTPTTERHS